MSNESSEQPAGTFTEPPAAVEAQISENNQEKEHELDLHQAMKSEPSEAQIPPEPVSGSIPAPPTADDEDDESYDPTEQQENPDEQLATANVQSATKEPAPAGNQDSEDESYDPTENTTLATSSTAATASSAFDPAVTKSLTEKLFSDPSFLSLSFDEQQKRVLEEYQKLVSAESENQPVSASGPRHDLSVPMTAEESELYEAYLASERKVNHRQELRPNSKLFIGNLPGDYMTKEGIFRVFHKYGKILSITFKGQYGFVQFQEPESVSEAIQAESNYTVDGHKLIMEVAKNSRPAEIENRQIKEQAKRARSLAKDETVGYVSRNQRQKVVECQLYSKPNVDQSFARDISISFQNLGIVAERQMLKAHQRQQQIKNDAAYSGVMSVGFVNGNGTLNLYIFDKAPDGGVRFDEYLSVSASDAAQLILREKNTRQTKPRESHGQNQNQNRSSYQQQGNRNGYGNNQQYQQQQHQHDRSRNNRNNYNHNDGGSYGNRAGGRYNNNNHSNRRERYNPYNNVDPNYNQHQQQQQQQQHSQTPPPAQLPQLDPANLMQSLQNLPPQTLQSLISLATSQQQQQQQYPGYTPSPSTDVHALLSSLATQAPHQTPFQYPPQPQMNYPPQFQYQQQQGQGQGQAGQSQPSSVKDLLASLEQFTVELRPSGLQDSQVLDGGRKLVVARSLVVQAGDSLLSAFMDKRMGLQLAVDVVLGPFVLGDLHSDTRDMGVLLDEVGADLSGESFNRPDIRGLSKDQDCVLDGVCWDNWRVVCVGVRLVKGTF
ncbi:hypothetical protein WICPIJ_001327 [Wickerhamomyces pijperi]|uniref:RRM domain-containing protein n=1 Tax=Wickerhamomyces pijperi TaxID=599730 RepID=A0A9P8QDZ0_WICPI|nr:hypothetical protein WICPIJ_001327 [Wickerhamomyces pijperi]